MTNYKGMIINHSVRNHGVCKLGGLYHGYPRFFFSSEDCSVLEAKYLALTDISSHDSFMIPVYQSQWTLHITLFVVVNLSSKWLINLGKVLMYCENVDLVESS